MSNVNFLGAVNRVLRISGIIRGDSDPITSFSDLAHNATMNLAQIAIQSVLTDLAAYYDLPQDRKQGEITLIQGQRVYDLADDFLHFWNNPGFFYDSTQNMIICEFDGGEQKLSREIFDYKTQQGYPNNFYVIDGLTSQVGFYQVPNNNIAASNAYGSLTFNSIPSVGTQAAGNISFNNNPSNGDTLTINGTVITFVTGTATGNQVYIGVNYLQTLAALQALLLTTTDGNLNQCSYQFASNEITITYFSYGTTGNSATFSTTSAALAVTGSGTLLGGTNPDTVSVNGTTFVFVASSSAVTSMSGVPVPIGSTAAISANNLYHVLFYYEQVNSLMSVFESEAVVTFLAILQGSIGASYTLSSSTSSIIPSGATLNGANGRVIVYDYIRDPIPILATDPMPFIRDIEVYKFCELAAVKFNSLFTQEAKMPSQNVEVDPTYVSARADLLKLIRPTKPSKRYGRTYNS